MQKIINSKMVPSITGWMFGQRNELKETKKKRKQRISQNTNTYNVCICIKPTE